MVEREKSKKEQERIREYKSKRVREQESRRIGADSNN
jgi:hypothetical protein